MSVCFPKRLKTGPSIGWGSLDGNQHGPKVDGEATTLRSTMLVCYLDNGMMPPPRFLWGVRVYVYAPSGRCWHLDLMWRSERRYRRAEAEAKWRGRLYVEQMKERGQWPPSGPLGGDYLGAMLGAAGLGLTITEREDHGA